jgi:tetratricopeptide (TPR) repeat protein
VTVAKAGSPLAAQRAEQLTDLALFLQHVQPSDPEQHESEALLSEAVTLKPSRRGYRLLAAATEDDNKRRLAVEAGIALPGGDEAIERARLLVEQGTTYEQAGRLRLAEQAFGEAARLVPSLYTATLGLARLAQSRGLASVGYQRILPLLESAPSMLTLRAHAELLSRLGRHREAEAAYQAMLKQQPDDDEALRYLISRRRAAGNIEEALTLLTATAGGEAGLSLSAARADRHPRRRRGSPRRRCSCCRGRCHSSSGTRSGSSDAVRLSTSWAGRSWRWRRTDGRWS